MATHAVTIKKLIIALGFVPVDGEDGVFQKKYTQHDGYILRVDFANEDIEYADTSFDESGRISVGSKSTSNFSKQENFVVLECVNRLLEKGYAPNSIELEKVYPSGRGHSGEVDILVNDADGQAFLMIECKTWGKEYTKETEKMLASGGQLFSYFKNATSAKSLCLYTSRLVGSKTEYENSIVDVSADWKLLSEIKDIHKRWNKIFKKNGVFEEYASPYIIVHKRLTYSDLATMKDEDSKKIHHQIMTILRQNGVSDKPNAFNKLLNLFVCKIIDEDRNPDDELQFQCWESLSDVKLQMTLNDLYKEGMWRFLEIRVIDHSENDVNKVLQELGIVRDTAHKKKLLEMFSDTRLKKSPNFAFIEVQDEKTFQLNAQIVREIVELLQQYKFRYEQKHEFLGNFFEKMLNTSMKQEAGQFFTPVPITRFIISSLPIRCFVQEKIDNKDPDPLPAVIDYACGSGHFLTEFMSTMQIILETVDVSNASPRTRGKLNAWRGDVKFSWADKYVYGIDFDNRLVKTAKVSAFFNGDGEATIIWGDGLDSFEHSEVYRGKLKETMPNKQDNGQFDILISNPPYSVEAFRSMLRHGAESFDLYNGLTDSSTEIECLFVERMKQLLKIGGWAGVILPASMLTGEQPKIYARTRGIILKYFKVKAIVELGSGTFMETSTQTSVLFLERRPDNDHTKITQAISDFFKVHNDVTVLGIERAFSVFVSSVYNDLAFDDYLSLVNKKPTKALKEHELWRDYVKEFGSEPYENAFEIEKEKMLFFLLTYEQNIVIASSGSKKEDIRAFLGYKFSDRRGDEGIKYLATETMLYGKDGDSHNPQKINSYILNAFADGSRLPISDTLENHISYGYLNSFIEFGTSKFNKRLNLRKPQMTKSRYPIVRLGEYCEVRIGGTPSRNQPEYFTGDNLWVSVSELNGEEIFDTKEKITLDAIKNSSVKLIKKGTTLMSFKLSIGKTAIAGKDLYTNEAIAALVPTSEEYIVDKYLFCLIDAGFLDLHSIKGDNAFGKSLNSEHLKALRLPLPPIVVQQQIINFYEVATQDIKQINESIARIQKSIIAKFLEMFGDPVGNPLSWKCEPLSTLGELNRGISKHRPRNAPELLGGEHPLIQTAEVAAADLYITKYTSTYSDVGLRQSRKWPKGTLCITIAANIAKTAILDFDACFPDSIVGFIPNDKVSQVFIHYWFSFFQKALEEQAPQLAQKNINLQILRGLKVILPPINAQNVFADFAHRTYETIANHQQALDDALKNRNAVLLEYL